MGLPDQLLRRGRLSICVTLDRFGAGLMIQADASSDQHSNWVVEKTVAKFMLFGTIPRICKKKGKSRFGSIKAERNRRKGMKD